MDPDSVRTVMVIVALVTPAVGAAIWLMGRSLAQQTGEPMPPPMRRAALVLLLAGPLNALAWWLLGDWLRAVGHRSAVGYGLAAAVFILFGWLSGAFHRWRERIRPARPDRE